MTENFLARRLNRLRIWHGTSMANRIMVAAMGLSMSVVLAVGATAYLSLHAMLDEQVENRLATATAHARQRLLDRLERDMRGMDELARRSLVANAVIDTEGRGGYLRPFLLEHQRSRPEMLEIGLHDWDGQPLVSSADFPVRRQGLVEEVSASSRTRIWLVNQPRGHRLLVAAPVMLPATGTVEGALIAEISLDKLVSQVLDKDVQGVYLELLDAEGRRIYQSNPHARPEDLIRHVAPLGKSELAGDLSLRLVASISRGQAQWPLFKLQMVFAALALFTALAAWSGARALARHVTEPLAKLSAHAQDIASDGVANLRELEVKGHDEVAWMAMAFNAMVRSLREVYAELEDRVHERTSELERRELYLRALLDNFPFMIWLKDEESRFLAVNKVMSDACGQPSPEAMSGLSDLDVWPADLAARYRADDREVMAGGKERVAEEPVEGQAERHWIETYKKPVIAADGRVLGTVGFARDISERMRAEEAMRLRDRAVMSTSDGIVITDMTQPGQPVIFVNPAFETITGYSFDDIRGLNCSFLQGDERDQEALNLLRDAIREGRECRVVLRNYRKDGSLFWNELTLSPVRDAGGRVTHYVGIQHDITEAIRARDAIRESERRLTLTLDALRDGLWDWRIAQGDVYQSPSWAAMLGYAPGEIRNGMAAFRNSLPEEERERVFMEIDAHLEGRSEVFVCEHRMIRKDGGEIWVSDRGRVVEWDAEGRPSRMVGTISDISARYRAEQEILTWMRRLDSILTLSPDAYVYFDAQGRVASVNLAFERMTGLLSGDIQGKPYADFVAELQKLADPGQDFPDLETLFQRANRRRQTLDDPAQPFPEQGGMLVDISDDAPAPQHGASHLHLLKPAVRVLAFDIRANESGDSSVLFLHDVTRETEVDRMKSEFLSTAAHELRTPMASIMGFSELLLLRPFAPEATKDMLQTIHRQSKRLTGLLNELLDLARIESRAGKHFDFHIQELAPLIQDSLAVSAGREGQGAARVEMADDLPQARMDAGKIQQALLNVLSNAYKYSPQGGEVSVRVWHGGSGERERLYISVRDQGIGMTPEQTARVFERFFRADPSGNIPGTGLGMSLVKEIMEFHGGGVEVQSQAGAGTEVTLWLPAVRETEETAT